MFFVRHRHLQHLDSSEISVFGSLVGWMIEGVLSYGICLCTSWSTMMSFFTEQQNRWPEIIPNHFYTK
jgi:hypothetical protein